MIAARVALVTGGSRGIGFAVAQRLHADGAYVALASRTRSELEHAAKRLGDDRVSIHAVDLSNFAAATALVDEVHERHGRLDVLVCSQGVYPGARSVLDITANEFGRVFAINVTGVFACAQQAARLMLAGGRGGRIVLVSSMNALAAQEGAADYDASKASLHGLARAMAVELAPHAITANVVAPGWIRTEMSSEELDELEGMMLNPSGTVGEPDDIARAVQWLADPDNSYVTGSVVVVDGGQTAMLPLPRRQSPDQNASSSAANSSASS